MLAPAEQLHTPASGAPDAAAPPSGAFSLHAQSLVAVFLLPLLSCAVVPAEISPRRVSASGFPRVLTIFSPHGYYGEGFRADYNRTQPCDYGEFICGND